MLGELIMNICRSPDQSSSPDIDNVAMSLYNIRDECIEEGRLDCIRNDEIRQRLQQRSSVEVVKEKRLNWRAKVIEKPGSLVGKVLAGEVEGRRP